MPRDGIEPPTRGFSSQIFSFSLPLPRDKSKKRCDTFVPTPSDTGTFPQVFSKRGVPVHPQMPDVLISRVRTKARGELPPNPTPHLPLIAASTPMPMLAGPREPPRITPPATEPRTDGPARTKPDSLERAYKKNAKTHAREERKLERRRAREERVLSESSAASEPVGDDE